MTPARAASAQKRRARFFRWHRSVAAFLALSPPIGCVWFVQDSGRWDLFERTGSITAAVGLLLASRRHLEHGIVELASLHHDARSQLNVEDDIHSTKLGLALSAFGTVIWGWGQYLRWWSFLFVPVWSLFVLRDAWRDRCLLAQEKSIPPVN